MYSHFSQKSLFVSTMCESFLLSILQVHLYLKEHLGVDNPMVYKIELYLSTVSIEVDDSSERRYMGNNEIHDLCKKCQVLFENKNAAGMDISDLTSNDSIDSQYVKASTISKIHETTIKHFKTSSNFQASFRGDVIRQLTKLDSVVQENTKELKLLREAIVNHNRITANQASKENSERFPGKDTENNTQRLDLWCSILNDGKGIILSDFITKWFGNQLFLIGNISTFMSISTEMFNNGKLYNLKTIRSVSNMVNHCFKVIGEIKKYLLHQAPNDYEYIQTTLIGDDIDEETKSIHRIKVYDIATNIESLIKSKYNKNIETDTKATDIEGSKRKKRKKEFKLTLSNALDNISRNIDDNLK